MTQDEEEPEIKDAELTPPSKEEPIIFLYEDHKVSRQKKKKKQPHQAKKQMPVASKMLHDVALSTVVETA